MLLQEEKFYYVEQQYKKYIIDLLGIIRKNIERGKQVEFDYKRSDGGKRRYETNPIAIVFNEYYFYLIREIERKSSKFEIVFRVDRIKKFKETNKNSTYPYGRFEEGKYRKKVQFMYTGDFKIIEETDKGYKVRAEIYCKGVKRWILSQNEFLKVTKIQDYVDEIKNTIQKMYDLYND